MPIVPPARPPRILILTMSAGSGHVSAASALAEALRQQNPRATVIIADHTELIGGHHGHAFTKGYQMLTAYFPRLWQAFYRLADFDFSPRLCAKLRQLFSRVGERRLVMFVAQGKFDYVICTHFAAAHIIAAMKTANKLALPLAVVITDFGLHRIWLAGKAVHHYFVASENTRQQLRIAGVPAGKIVVTGIPIKKQFQTKCHRRPTRPAAQLRLLIVETRLNYRPLLRLLYALAALKEHLRLTIVGLAPSHLALVKKNVAHLGLKAKVRGFVPNMARYFATHDLAITKSGGLTTAEAMAMGTPLLVLRPIPGQETTNLAALQKASAGLYAADEEQARDLLVDLIAKPAKLRQLQKATAKLAKPQAATDIVKVVLGDLAKRKKKRGERSVRKKS